MKGEAGHIDPRTPITAWDLLVWAYKRQMVRYEGDRAWHPQHFSRLSGTAAAAANWGMRGVDADERGCINGAGTTAHDDAHVVHEFILRTVEPNNADLIMRAAERGALPDWDPELPPARVIPARKPGGGAIRMIYGNSNRPIACMVEYEGVPQHEARAIRQAARDTYSVCWQTARSVSLSFGIPQDGLLRWKVDGIGVKREPWSSCLHRSTFS